jgi:CheY-like chemotaxis protein
MLTALVIDGSAAARRQVTGLLELSGWGVHEAGDAEDARWLSAAISMDLVVTAATVSGAADGAALLTELRAAGSTARFLMVTPEPTDGVRAAAAAAGALACLAAPVDARLLLDLVRSRSAASAGQPVVQDTVDVRDMVDVEDLHDSDLDADLLDRLQDMYDAALPTRFSAIDRSVRAGDERAAAAAAHTLAGTSGQLGHPEVAVVCQAIAADARRGIMSHSLVSELAGLTGVDRRGTDRRSTPRAAADRRIAGTDRRAQLASAADAVSGRLDLGGLLQAADAATGRLAARRRGMAA